MKIGHTEVNDLFNLNYGSNPFGWSNTFMWLLMVAIMFMFGEQGAGISLMIFGGLSIFLNTYIGFHSAVATMVGGVIPVLFICVGMMVVIRNLGRDTR